MDENTGQKSPNAPPSLVDTHAHLDFVDFEEDREAVVERARQAGLVAIITIGIEPGEWQSNLDLAARYEIVHPALGIHPNSANQTNPETLEQLATLCKQEAPGRVVAVGETGLDYYRQYVSHDIQRESFRAHLDLARQLDLPVIIHNRDAHDDVLEVLKRDVSGRRGVMHSFSGDMAFAMECIALGYMISLAGPVTFRNAADKHVLAARLPLEYLLVETDCPFLTPEPYRGRRNEPYYVQFTARAIARLRDTSYEEVAQATTNNALRLFGLPDHQIPNSE
jgi:TatD DNase family protein